MKVWGIHMGEKVGSSPLENNYVAIGWHALGDLSRCAGSREQLKDALVETFPDIKKARWRGVVSLCKQRASKRHSGVPLQGRQNGELRLGMKYYEKS
jgi:hypothetical protein